MTKAKSFEEMGREADRAGRDFALAQLYLSELTEEQAGTLVTVTLARASWDNGSMRLAEMLTTVVRARLPELLHDALSRLQQESVDSMAAVRAAFDAGATPDPFARQVPRDPPAPTFGADPSAPLGRSVAAQEAIRAAEVAADPALTAHAPDTRPPADQHTEAPLPGVAQSRQDAPVNPHATAWNALPREAQELLTWVGSNPTSRFARTPSRDVLVAKGYLGSNGNGQNATWDLTAEGRAILPPHSVG